MCTICGVDGKHIFHALVTCPMDRALRMAMRDILKIPGEEIFNCSGLNWLLILLDQLSLPLCGEIIFIFRRA